MAQQRQMHEMSRDIRAGVQDEIGGLWAAMRERDERANPWQQKQMTAMLQRDDSERRAPVAPPSISPLPPQRDLQAIGRAERAEAALAIKEAECEALRQRLRELESGRPSMSASSRTAA